MIYDCFTFFNELDLLEIRLNVLNEVVDKFVLVESNKTHSGKEKPLYFENNKKRFNTFLDKIIHIVVDDMPLFNGNPWELEHYQRNQIKRGLENCRPGDVILISDLDEIPKPESIRKIHHLNGTFIFRQNMYYYFLNYQNVTQKKWHGTVGIKFPLKHSPQYYRELSILSNNINDSDKLRALYYWIKILPIVLKNHVSFVYQGGWHFSYLGGIEAIIKKLDAFAHQEYNKDEYKNPDKIKEKIESGKDLFNRKYVYKLVPIDHTYPEYIVKNQKQYAHLIFNAQN